MLLQKPQQRMSGEASKTTVTHLPLLKGGECDRKTVCLHVLNRGPLAQPIPLAPGHKFLHRLRELVLTHLATGYGYVTGTLLVVVVSKKPNTSWRPEPSLGGPTSIRPEGVKKFGRFVEAFVTFCSPFSVTGLRPRRS
jgi:hypothetical protein